MAGITVRFAASFEADAADAAPSGENVSGPCHSNASTSAALRRLGARNQ